MAEQDREQLQLERLVKELAEGSGYHHDYSDGWQEESIQFVFGKDTVKIEKKHAYDGIEDWASEDFYDKWECEVSRESIDNAILELIKRSKATLFQVKVTENYSGKAAYNNRSEDTTKIYTTNIKMRLQEGEKPVIKLKNPKEVQNAGFL